MICTICTMYNSCCSASFIVLYSDNDNPSLTDVSPCIEVLPWDLASLAWYVPWSRTSAELCYLKLMILTFNFVYKLVEKMRFEGNAQRVPNVASHSKGPIVHHNVTLARGPWPGLGHRKQSSGILCQWDVSYKDTWFYELHRGLIN
jgi:hypothetical protein